MAGRVNKKFVVILSIALVVVAVGVAFVGYYALQGRVDGWVRKADALAAEGKWDEASRLYERAVGHDQTNQEWLVKWRDAMVKTTPDNRARYEQQYDLYRGILRTLSSLNRTNPEYALEYMKEFDRFVRLTSSSRAGYEALIDEVESRSRDLDPANPMTKKMLAIGAQAQVDRMTLTTVDEDERTVALARLEAAAEADPKDIETRVGVIRWHAAEAERHRRDRNADEASASLAKMRELLGKLVAEYPNHPQVALTSLVFDQSEGLRATAEQDERLAFIGKLQSSTRDLANMALNAPDELFDIPTVERIVAVIRANMRAEGADLALKLLDRALAKEPASPGLLISRGQVLQDQKEHAEALAVFQKVVDLPDLTVSLDGLLLPSRRMNAMAQQIDTALLQWNDAENDQDRKTALDRARSYRDVLAKEAGVRGREFLTFRDAKIAFASQDFDEALKLLSELRVAGQDNIDVLQLLAQTLEAKGTYGDAVKLLEEMRQIAPQVSWIHVRLGENYGRMGQLNKAVEAYEEAAKTEPSNEAIAARLSQMKDALSSTSGEADPDKITDPVVRGILLARKAQSSGDMAEARRILEELWAKAPTDRRILRDLLQLDLGEKKRDVALGRINKLLELTPEDNELKQLKTRLEIEDPVEAQLAVIEAADVEAHIKAINRFKVYLDAGRHEEARAALVEAEKLSPNNPTIVDYAFVVALGEKNFEKAQQLVQRAAELDLDEVNGMLYQGRLQLIEGETNPEKLTASATTFEAVVKKLPFNTAARRLLATSYAKLGRVGAALEQYRLAYEGNPVDPQSVKEYAVALMQANQGRQAWELVEPKKGALNVLSSDPELYRLWVDLEADYGDREVAIKQREFLLRTKPEDLRNNVALAGMYVDDKRWEDADRVIKSLEESGKVDAITLTNLSARSLARRGEIDPAMKLFQDYLARELDKKEHCRGYLAFSEFLMENRKPEEATAAMRKAVEYQDPTIMEADRSLGDYYFNKATELGQASAVASDTEDEKARSQLSGGAQQALQLAATHYEKVIASLPAGETKSLVQRRTAETYLRLEQYDSMRRLVDQLAKETPDDLQVLLLQGSLASATGDRRAARQFYDRAVQLNPSNPSPFFQRALFNSSGDPEAAKAMLNDVLQDLEQVTKLRPSQYTAWARRYRLLKDAGRESEAFAVLRQGIDVNPETDQLRMMFLRELVFAQRIDEAQKEVLRAVEANPARGDWLRIGYQVFSSPQIGRWREAADMARRYYEKDKTPENARIALDALLRPNTDAARPEVQQLLSAWEPKADPNSFLDELLKARAAEFTGQTKEFEKCMGKALDLLPLDGQSGNRFIEQLNLAKKNDWGATFVWLADTSKKRKLPPHLLAQLLIFQSNNPKAVPSVLIGEADKLLATTTDPETRLELFKLQSRLQYSQKNYEESAKAAREALKIKDSDLETNNNLAYMLVTHLGNAQEGLEFAKRAVQIEPTVKGRNTATVVDTLGWTQYQLGQYEEAVATLTRAAQIAVEADESFIAWIHLGHAHLKKGDKGEARRALREAETLTQRSTNAPNAAKEPEYAALMEELRKSVE